MNIQPPTIELLFPTPIYKNKVDYKLGMDALQKIQSGEYKQGNTGSLTDMNHRLLDDPLFQGLKAELQKHVEFYAKEIFKYDTVDVYITQSWLNVNPTGSYHNKHNHMNSVFSGVFYISVPDGAPFLSFHSPLKHMFHIEPEEWNVYNSPFWTTAVADGDVVLFPSLVEHEVLTNTSSNTRLCIAFNTFLRGSIGDRDSSHSNYQEIA